MRIDTSIFKAYDIRGVYPDQLDEEIMYAIGQGYASVIKPTKPVAVGCDVRISSPVLKKSLIEGLLDAGIDVVDIGLISTEMVYFAVGNYGFGGGIQVTASHNTREWNGAKMVREGVIPISGESGLGDIRDFVVSSKKIVAAKRGKLEHKDILDDFCRYILTWVDYKNIKPQKVVYNPNFGYEGVALRRLVEIGDLPLELVPLNADPDGNFPKGRPDPFIPENRPEFVELVKSTKADLGVTWDADADRVFFCADGGTFVDPCYINSLLIKLMLERYPKSNIIYDPRYTWAQIDAIVSNGGQPLLERVGHSFIKARMRAENSPFSGESSGHTFYRDFWFSDSGLIPFMQVLEILSLSEKKLSELVGAIMDKYPISGEINFTVKDAKAIVNKVKNVFSDSKLSELDGIACEYSDWRFSLRGSNTEPLLRLNLEARNKKLLGEKIVELTNLIEEK